VTPFDRLHPALQHHIVNSLGWQDLRPFQQAVIEPVLAGRHLLILAPTAGGKTEAAFFPVLSRMLTDGWRGLSVLYVCPIKALLNNLDARLERYCSLLGRRSALWHGDIAAGRKKAVLRDPPDCLLTTPESLEVMLVSPGIEAQPLFAGMQAVIVDGSTPLPATTAAGTCSGYCLESAGCAAGSSSGSACRPRWGTLGSYWTGWPGCARGLGKSASLLRPGRRRPM
jgi:Lhr-like helicase